MGPYVVSLEVNRRGIFMGFSWEFTEQLMEIKSLQFDVEEPWFPSSVQKLRYVSDGFPHLFGSLPGAIIYLWDT